MQEIHIFISGSVQGVGFRALVKRHAMLHNIKGYVRNLSDGRVEICAQGLGDQINQFIQTIRSNPGAGCISDIETKHSPQQGFYSSFEVR